MYICVGSTCGSNLVGINKVGTKIAMTLSQPMKNWIWELNQSGIFVCCVAHAVSVIIPTKPYSFIGQPLRVTF